MAAAPSACAITSCVPDPPIMATLSFDLGQEACENVDRDRERGREAEVDRPGDSSLGERDSSVRDRRARGREPRSEEHTSELQSLMRISYAVFCLKKKKT